MASSCFRGRRVAAGPAPKGARASRANTWHDVVAIPASGTSVQGTENAVTTTATFKPVQAKFVRITETDSPENAPGWSIQQLRLYEAAPAGGK
jgi:hypothetical protein